MENALGARRWPQRLGQLWVLAIILCLPLFDSSLGNAQSLQIVNMAIPSKSFQMIIYPVAQQRAT